MPPIEHQNRLPVGHRLSREQRRAVGGGIVALAIAWLAWMYWFSRAALLAMATLAVGLLLLLAIQLAYRMLRTGESLYRHLSLQLLLSLARRLI
jgi:hypothetical protein